MKMTLATSTNVLHLDSSSLEDKELAFNFFRHYLTTLDRAKASDTFTCVLEEQDADPVTGCHGRMAPDKDYNTPTENPEEFLTPVSGPDRLT